MDTDEKMKVLEEENARLKEELQTTKEHLKKYTQHQQVERCIMKIIKRQ